MASKLDQIKDWPALAFQAKYRAMPLGRLCGMPKSTFYRNFRIKFGMGPQSWLQGQRDLKTRELLAAGHNATAVAAQVGFINPAQFNRSFKKRTGLLPYQLMPRLGFRARLKAVPSWRVLARSCRWDLHAICKAINVRRYQLRRYFVRQYGIDPKSWLARKRMEHAASLLRKGQSPIQARKAIGLTRHPFRAAFAKQFGVTPAQYRSMSPKPKQARLHGD